MRTFAAADAARLITLSTDITDRPCRNQTVMPAGLITRLPRCHCDAKILRAVDKCDADEMESEVLPFREVSGDPSCWTPHICPMRRTWPEVLASPRNHHDGHCQQSYAVFACLLTAI